MKLFRWGPPGECHYVVAKNYGDAEKTIKKEYSSAVIEALVCFGSYVQISNAVAGEELKEYEKLFDLQQKRMEKAVAAWRAAHPEQKNVLPDLGVLLDWLLNFVEGRPVWVNGEIVGHFDLTDETDGVVSYYEKENND